QRLVLALPPTGSKQDPFPSRVLTLPYPPRRPDVADNSTIEWTDATWNPVTGCTKVSPGCDHCYAERLHERFHGKGSFAVVRRDEEKVYLPLRWRKPRRIFVNSM